ncbi:MAG: amidohydrolase family protein [Acidimicrobiaceae bacterium]|nr:amidohydrolase family protein [Acidimicrobiaceae bacterium]MDE0517796.1 amidohydrolase family protein [Acidimicrobiaceae bacterium]MDE0656269.1 amidohydrolase family protein [Acidimicrobiaceae bacterium]MXZ95133.1 amidohydrolase family protein [Acidimicrobiaceae bacterium]MYF43488.1 amidohydrolase family protein [Acidimicrobiaceae bacterium]
MTEPFVDSHHHLWDMDQGHYHWLEEEEPEETAVVGDYSAIRRNYLIGDLLADFEGSSVIKSVHVQAEYGGDDQVWETAWLQQVADAHGYPHAIVAKTDLASEGARAELERHGEHANMRGIRNFVQGEDLLTPEFRRGLQALSDLGFSYDLNSTWEGMGEARQAAEMFGDLQFILGHCGVPMERTAEYFDAWRAGMATLAGAPNVACKISGLGMTDHSWTVESIRPWVLECIEVFGVERCMFGSNWPVDSLYSSYRAVVEAYREITADFSADERSALFRRNAEHYYKV